MSFGFVGSHPTWVRGLKLTGLSIMLLGKVAPYVGAWIETDNTRKKRNTVFLSHPTWVRGLKPRYAEYKSRLNVSHPTWVRGLKQFGSKERAQALGSRTLRGCVD